MPSLPAMVYLEKEVMTIDDSIDQFLYSQDYIDALFDPTTPATEAEGDAELNIDLLLAMQNWRKGKLDNYDQLDWEIWDLEWGSKERLRLEYLKARS